MWMGNTASKYVQNVDDYQLFQIVAFLFCYVDNFLLQIHYLKLCLVLFENNYYIDVV